MPKESLNIPAAHRLAPLLAEQLQAALAAAKRALWGQL
jgi:hypothetical protein